MSDAAQAETPTAGHDGHTASGEEPAPIPDGANGTGHDLTTGRFLPGNAGGTGNPYARQVAALRAVILQTVTPAEVRLVVLALLKEAKAGNVMAIREVLDRCLGKVPLAVAVQVEDDKPKLRLRIEIGDKLAALEAREAAEGKPPEAVEEAEGSSTPLGGKGGTDRGARARE